MIVIRQPTLMHVDGWHRTKSEAGEWRCRSPGRRARSLQRLKSGGDKAVDAPGELQIELGDPAGGVRDEAQVQGAPAQVHVRMVVELLGDIRDRDDGGDGVPEARQLGAAVQAVAVPGPQR